MVYSVYRGNFMNLEKLFTLHSFAFSYHWHNTACALVEDSIIHRMTGRETCDIIQSNVGRLAQVIYPDTDGKTAEKQLMHRFICPLPLAVAAFSENSLKNAVRFGASQLVLINQGWYSLPWRLGENKNRLSVFDINRADITLKKGEMILDAHLPYNSRLHLIAHNGYRADCLATQPQFDKNKNSFVMLGAMPLFMDSDRFATFMTQLGHNLAEGSTVVFAYGDADFYTEKAGSGAVFIRKLAQPDADSGYTYRQMEKLLSDSGFHIYEHLSPQQMHTEYLHNCEVINGIKLPACDNVNYVLAVKKHKKSTV